MEIKNIPTPKLYNSMRPEVREIRMNAPDFLSALVGPLHEKGVFQDIQSVEDIEQGNIAVLEGGVNSACYWIQEPQSAIALKIQRDGVDSEVEWLGTYADLGVPVPRVLASGVIPGVEVLSQPLRYIALEGITDNLGERAATARKFVNEPSVLTGISRQMGALLAKIHSAPSDKPFGYYIDQERGTPTFDTWRKHLINNFTEDALIPIGISAEDRIKLISVLETIDFPEKGAYLHGDYNLHNVLVVAPESTPPEIKIIDPSPMIGDPIYDIANVASMEELIQTKKALDIDPKEIPKLWWEGGGLDYQTFLDAYVKVSGISIDPKRMAANQLASMLRSYWKSKDRADTPLTEAQQRQIAFESNLRQQLIRQKVGILIGEAPKTATSAR